MKLTLSRVDMRREARRVLQAIDAEFPSGTLTAVLGPNGAGKSTLLSIAAGLVQPTSGHVRYDERDMRSITGRELARLRAYLPQNPRVEWPLAVERVVALGLTPQLPVFGGSLPQDRAALEAVLGSCGLLELRTRPATSLSGGELARVMLARALVGDPQVLIVDEPTAGLDPRHAIDACQRLRARADAGCTVIVAMHDLNLAARFADRVVALRGGTVLYAGAAASAFDAAVLEQLFDVRVRVARASGATSVEFY